MTDIMGSIIDSQGLTIGTFLICTAFSLILGFAIAWIHSYKNSSSRGFQLSLILVPVIVQVIILMVNGNLGAGVAVAGAFSLVRFRSAPGSAREICSLFLSMAIGLATGMGYLTIAVLAVLIVGLVTVLLAGSKKFSKEPLSLKITVPENFDYNGEFEPVLANYVDSYELSSVKTSQMGTVYRLSYDVDLKPGADTRKLLDDIRVKNGNLEVSLGKRALRDQEQL
ncbi:MAG: DUF4956 domain-containing protein [Oscillospiraceae bacterium]|jgi:hypothetical protein